MRPSPPGSALLDAAATVERLGLKPAIFQQLLTKFTQTHGDVAGRIETALMNGDRATAMRDAHTVKGVTATLGAHLLCDAARELEQAIEAGRETDALLAQFGATVSATVEAITAWVGPDSV